MRTFNFKARNIGQEKYLTYTMGEGCELDEDVLDYIEEHEVKEVVKIIYEEDDDYDYLTYDISKLTSFEEYMKGETSCEAVLMILRNVANNLISLKEQAVPLAYVLLNRSFMYVNPLNFDVQFICLPIESQAKIMKEFKSFIRQLLANMVYDVEEDLSYVGKLLTYINGDAFNLRGLIGLTEALMEEAGIFFEEAGAIEAADGVEVVSSEPDVMEMGTEEKKSDFSDFMNNLDSQEEALPEIGDDEADASSEDMTEMTATEEATAVPEPEISEETTEAVAEEPAEAPVEETSEETTTETETEDAAEEPADFSAVAEAKYIEEPEEELESILPPGLEGVTTELIRDDLKEDDAEEEEETYEPEEEQVRYAPETDVDILKSRIKQIYDDKSGAKTNLRTSSGPATINSLDDLDSYLGSKPPVVKRNVVKVNRAAIIQNVAAEEGMEELDEALLEGQETDATEGTTTEDSPKSKSVLSKTVSDAKEFLSKPIGGEAKSANTLLNAPKAMPYLVRVNTEERVMLNKPVFKLGKATRGVDYTVSGNGAISRQHAIISQRDGVCYIKDNKSTNHTYVNGKMVEEGTEEILTHESMITLGDEDFIFKIR